MNALCGSQAQTLSGEIITIIMAIRKKYGGLYFISSEEYRDETYQNLYAFVSPLFSDDLHSIEASKDMIRFTVLLTSNIGTDSSLVWTNGEKAPTGTYPTVQRQRQLDAHWYAITASD